MIETFFLACSLILNILVLTALWCIHENLRMGYYTTRRPKPIEKYDRDDYTISPPVQPRGDRSLF